MNGHTSKKVMDIPLKMDMDIPLRMDMACKGIPSILFPGNPKATKSSSNP